MLLFVIPIIFGVSNAYADAMHGNKPVRGWFWYDDNVVEEPKKAEIPKPPVPKEPEKKQPEKAEKKDFEFPVIPEAPPVLATMLKDPTEENAMAYLDWQFKYFQHLKKIGYTLRHAYLKWGADIYPTSGLPENALNSLQFRTGREEAEDRIINNLLDKVGIIYFYAKDDPTCITQKRILSTLLEENPFSIRGVSYDGKIDTELPFPSVYKPSLFSDYNIQKIPTIMAVMDLPEGPKTLYIGVGLTGVSAIRSQIINFLVQEGLIKEKDINPTFISTRSDGYIVQNR
jgi:thiol-disulfide isomerase/thioredoxin